MFHAMAGTARGTMFHETLEASRESLPDAVRELAEQFRKELNAVSIRTE
jgi:hypothetical protein